MSRALWLDKEELYDVTFTCVFKSVTAWDSDFALLSPNFLSLWAICRCKLLKSTVSASIIPNRPIPLAAKYRAAGQPRPPAPTISIDDFRSFLQKSEIF